MTATAGFVSEAVTNLGDQITRDFIRSVPCPVHGHFCHSAGPAYFCRRRMDQAVYLWHQRKVAQKRGRKVWLG